MQAAPFYCVPPLTTDWIGHPVVSYVIHAMIYGFVFKLMRHMSIGETAILAVVVLAVLFVWSRSGRRRSW